MDTFDWINHWQPGIIQLQISANWPILINKQTPGLVFQTGRCLFCPHRLYWLKGNSKDLWTLFTKGNFIARQIKDLKVWNILLWQYVLAPLTVGNRWQSWGYVWLKKYAGVILVKRISNWFKFLRTTALYTHARKRSLQRRAASFQNLYTTSTAIRESEFNKTNYNIYIKKRIGLSFHW